MPPVPTSIDPRQLEENATSALSAYQRAAALYPAGHRRLEEAYTTFRDALRAQESELGHALRLEAALPGHESGPAMAAALRLLERALIARLEITSELSREGLDRLCRVLASDPSTSESPPSLLALEGIPGLEFEEYRIIDSTSDTARCLTVGAWERLLSDLGEDVAIALRGALEAEGVESVVDAIGRRSRADPVTGDEDALPLLETVLSEALAAARSQGGAAIDPSAIAREVRRALDFIDTHFDAITTGAELERIPSGPSATIDTIRALGETKQETSSSTLKLERHKHALGGIFTGTETASPCEKGGVRDDARSEPRPESSTQRAAHSSVPSDATRLSAPLVANDRIVESATNRKAFEDNREDRRTAALTILEIANQVSDPDRARRRFLALLAEHAPSGVPDAFGRELLEIAAREAAIEDDARSLGALTQCLLLIEPTRHFGRVVADPIAPVLGLQRLRTLIEQIAQTDPKLCVRRMASIWNTRSELAGDAARRCLVRASLQPAVLADLVLDFSEIFLRDDVFDRIVGAIGAQRFGGALSVAFRRGSPEAVVSLLRRLPAGKEGSASALLAAYSIGAPGIRSVALGRLHEFPLDHVIAFLIEVVREGNFRPEPNLAELEGALYSLARVGRPMAEEFLRDIPRARSGLGKVYRREIRSIVQRIAKERER
jgi:hypothetical protein